MSLIVATSIIVYFVSQSVSTGKVAFLPRRKEFILYNFFAIILSCLFINVFVRRYHISTLITLVLFYILSLIMYYVHEFRGTNVNYSDILSIGTAKEVASGYKYSIKPIFILMLFVMGLGYFALLSLLNVKIENIDLSTNIGEYKFFRYEVKQILLFLLLFFLLKDKISKKQFDYSLNAGENEGYIYNFFSSIPIFHRSMEEQRKMINDSEELINYIDSFSKKHTAIKFTKIAQDYVKIQESDFDSSRGKKSDEPHIIVIMNESFGSIHHRIKTNIPVTSFFDKMKGVKKGNLYVNTFGGGTANTEFEFLTGMSIGNFPYPVMPYNNFVKNDKYSIVRYFNYLGYNTIAMHPYTATNYHRNVIYKRLGFNEMLFFDDFSDKEYVRDFVSDKSMYKEVIRRFEDYKRAGRKLFLFGITMQNHSGYNKFKGAKVSTNLKKYKGKESVNSYLSLMKISDDALHVLIDYFASIDDRTIILFFGDHNASFGSELNKSIYDVKLDYECTNEYITPFFIYDNKNKLDKEVIELSANFLSLELLKVAKLPFDIFQDMLNEVYEKYNIYNFHKAKDRHDNKLYNIPLDMYMHLEKEYLK